MFLTICILTSGCYDPVDQEEYGRAQMIPNVGENDQIFTRTREASYDESYQGQLVEQLTTDIGAMQEVDKVRVVIYDNIVLVGIVPKQSGTNEQEIETNISERIQQAVGSKEVVVRVDEDSFEEIKALDLKLRRGATFEEAAPRGLDLFQQLGEENNQGQLK